MKTFQTTLLAASFFAVTYALAPTTAYAGGWYCEWLAANQAQTKVDQSFDAALELARKGYPCIKEVDELKTDVDAENFIFANFPNQCLIQDMLDAEIADLRLRAQNFIAHEADINKSQFEMVLGRYERAVQQIQDAWKKGEVADDIAEKALFTLRVDAFDYLSSLGHVSIRARLQEAVLELAKRGEVAMDRVIASREFYVKVYTIRLEAALAVLQDRVTKGVATKSDFRLVAQIVEALGRLQNSDSPYNCGP